MATITKMLLTDDTFSSKLDALIEALSNDDVVITVNGVAVANPSFYAPKTSGTSGQVLLSKGSGNAPQWSEMPSGVAVQASQPTGQSTGDLWFEITG